MRIIFVTAHLPSGTDEAFLIPEIEELERAGHEVLIVPRSPRGNIVHDRTLETRARREVLMSARVLRRAMSVAVRFPRRTATAALQLSGGRSMEVTCKNLAVLPKALWLAEVAEQWKADHIHCHWAGTTATMAMLASIVSGVPWSMTAHRWDIVENNLLATKAGRARFVRFICDDGLRLANERGVRGNGNLRVLPMGVSMPSSSERSPRPRPLVLCPARLTAVKGHQVLLEAWRILKNRGVKGDLWLAGDGEMRPYLAELTSDLGLAGSVEFLGMLPHHELVKIYEKHAVSAVVLASLDMGQGLHEGVPVALIEAMSYGVPVVATRTGGVPELVTNDTGFLVPPANPPELADALQCLIEDEQLRNEMGEAAYRRVARTHDIARVATELVNAMRGDSQAISYVSNSAPSCA